MFAKWMNDDFLSHPLWRVSSLLVSSFTHSIRVALTLGWALHTAGARLLLRISLSLASASGIVPLAGLHVFSQASLSPVHHAVQDSLSNLAQIDSFSLTLFSTTSGEFLDVPWVPVYLVEVVITAHTPWHFATLTYTSITLYLNASPLRADTTIYLPRMEAPGRLQSMGLLGVRHDWATSLSLFTFTHWRRNWQPTPASLPGESQGRGSLVGCHLWCCTESYTNESM